MRIGILSDTHDHVARTRRAVRRLIDEGAEALIHCGDFTGPEVIFECAGPPGYFVFGNNDYEEAALRAAIARVGGVCLGDGGEVELAGRRIAVTHGHLIRESRRLEAARPDYLLSGHTHEPHDERVGPMRRINPGALHRASVRTVALLDLDTDSLQIVEIG